MPLALFLAACLFIAVAIKGNYPQAGALFQQTFFSTNGGNKGFFVWFASILGIAIIFRIIDAPRAGKAFLALLLVVYFMQNQGVLTSLESAIQTTGSSNNG